MIVAVPEATVEDACQTLVPVVLLLFGESAVEHGLYGLLVALHHRIDVFGTTGTSLNLEHAHACIHHLVDETDGFQVLWAHDVLVVNLQLVARLVVGDGVAAPANLHALAPVGRAVGVVEAHVALARDGHAECSVTEHLDAHGLSAGAADMFLLDVAVDVGHLLHAQLACQHHHVGKLCVELQCLDVRYVELCGEVHLHAHLPAVLHHGNVAGDDG